MLTNKRERARQQRAALWATRDNVQRHALSMSMPWLAFVNIAFALMIFFRNFIFTYFDKRLLTHRAVIPYIEAALIAVIIISAILVIIAVTPRLAQGRYTLNIITGLLLALSLCWSLSNYCFIFFWTLPGSVSGLIRPLITSFIFRLIQRTVRPGDQRLYRDRAIGGDDPDTHGDLRRHRRSGVR